jgi:hypothetical protein
MKESPVNKINPDYKEDTDVFNLMKYRILSSVAILNSLNCPVTARNVWRHMSSCYKFSTIRGKMSVMTNVELLARYSPTSHASLQYSLSSQGKRNLKAYQERHRNGFNLRLKKVPKKMDWSGISLLPDYKPEED